MRCAAMKQLFSTLAGPIAALLSGLSDGANGGARLLSAPAYVTMVTLQSPPPHMGEDLPAVVGVLHCVGRRGVGILSDTIKSGPYGITANHRTLDVVIDLPAGHVGLSGYVGNYRRRAVDELPLAGGAAVDRERFVGCYYVEIVIQKMRRGDRARYNNFVSAMAAAGGHVAEGSPWK